MANEYLLSEYADEAALQKQTAFILQTFDTIEAKAKSVGLSLKTSFDSLGNNSTGSKRLIDDFKKLDKATADFTNTTKVGTAAIKQHNIEITEAAKKQAVLTKEKIAAEKAVKAESKIVNDVSNDYKQLSLAYNDAALKAKNYTLQLGASNPVTVQAVKNAKDLGERLKEVDASVGQNQRNVGNYTNAILGAGQKAFGFIRTAANILPGLGLSGAFLLIFEGIKAVVTELGFFANTLNKTVEQSKKFNEVLAGGNSEYVKAVTQVSNLRIAFDQAREGIITKEEALKLYNETIGKTTGEVNSLDAAEQALAKNADAYIEFTLQKAAANIAAAKSAEKLFESITESRKKFDAPEQEATDIFGVKFSQKRLDEINSQQKAAFGAAQYTRSNALKTESEDYNNIYKEFLKNAEAIAKKFKFDFNGIGRPKTSGGDGKDGSLQALKDRTNNEFEIYKIGQEAKLRIYDADIKSDRVHFLDKIVALKNYVEASQELIDRQEKEDIANKKRAAAREIQRLEEEKKGKSPEQVARINQNIKITEQNLQRDLLLIQAQAADKSVQLSQNAANLKIQITEDYLKKENDAYNEYAKIDQQSIDEANNRFKKGLDKRLKAEEEAAKKLIELQKDLNKKKYDLAEEAEKFLVKLGEASIIREQNALRDLQDEREAKAARDIELVNASTANASEKADQILIINARLQAQKEQTEKKNRDLETQKAKFQRAQQIFEIGIGAIKAVSAIKAQAAILLSNPLTAAFAAVALAQIPFVVGGAALSIAGILATPIPRFFKGKKKGQAYEGPAIINDNPDGRTLEAITRADGSIEFPEGRNVLTNVGANDTIHPDRDVFMKSLQDSALRATARAANGKITEGGYMAAMTSVLGSKLDKLDGNLKKLVSKPIGNVNVYTKNEDYITSQTNWG
jgi:hypothetical protein